VTGPDTAIFFESPEELRRWLEEHHDRATEVWVGMHRKSTGQPSIAWADVVDEALCFGWIDGVRKSIDPERFATRLTPRRRGSTWSAVNIRRVAELSASGRMRPSGLAAFEARRESRSVRYSYEQREVRLAPEDEAELRANPAAWSFWDRQPPGYRRTATWWVISAVREDTRRRRLATLIADSAGGRRISLLRRNPT